MARSLVTEIGPNPQGNRHLALQFGLATLVLGYATLVGWLGLDSGPGRASVLRPVAPYLAALTALFFVLVLLVTVLPPLIQQRVRFDGAHLILERRKLIWMRRDDLLWPEVERFVFPRRGWLFRDYPLLIRTVSGRHVRCDLRYIGVGREGLLEQMSKHASLNGYVLVRRPHTLYYLGREVWHVQDAPPS